MMKPRPLLLSLVIGLLTLAAIPSAKALESLAADEVPPSVSNYTKQTIGTKANVLNLNDATDEAIRTYYQDLQGHAYNGQSLLAALKPILSNGQRYHNYDTGGQDIWRMYEITDRDWTLSPASEITNGVYDAETNTITNYYYGSFSTPRDNPYLHLFYRNPGVEKARWKAWDHHGDNNGTDREHLWPKSRGFSKNDDGIECTYTGARGDLHHLVAADSFVNSKSHSNYAYGFVDKTKTYDDADLPSAADPTVYYRIDGVSVVAGNLTGTSATLGAGKVFEPQDSDKGDIARAMFYMAARYNNIAGDDETIDAGNPNLFLEDLVDNSTLYSTPTRPVSLGILRDLLVWHHMDPVDEYEIHRNNLIFNNYDANRNPFIDFPEWADFVWGTATFDESAGKTVSYDSTPTGSVDLEKDVINGYRGPGGGDSSESSSSSESQDLTYRYVKASSADVGDKISLLHENGDTHLALSSFNSSNYGKGTSITVTDDAFEVGDELSFEVVDGASEGTVALQTSDGKYLSRNAATGTNIRLSDTLDNLSSWILDDSGDIPYLACANETSRVLAFRGSTYDSFAAYKKTNINLTEYFPVYVYKLTDHVTEAENWSTSFLNEWTKGCQEAGGYVAEDMHWTEAKSTFLNLPSAAKALLQESGAGEDAIGLAVARYDRIVSKYGTALFEDFLNRKPTNQQDALITHRASTASSGWLLAIIAISGLSVGAIALFVSKKNKRIDEAE